MTDLGSRALHILRLIGEAGPMSSRQISEKIDKPCSLAVGSLLVRGLIQVAGANGRGVTYSLTATGKCELAQYREALGVQQR